MLVAHESAVEACVHASREAALRSIAFEPTVQDLSVAEDLLDALLDANAKYLDPGLRSKDEEEGPAQAGGGRRGIAGQPALDRTRRLLRPRLQWICWQGRSGEQRWGTCPIPTREPGSYPSGMPVISLGFGTLFDGAVLFFFAW